MKKFGNGVTVPIPDSSRLDTNYKTGNEKVETPT